MTLRNHLILLSLAGLLSQSTLAATKALEWTASEGHLAKGSKLRVVPGPPTRIYPSVAPDTVAAAFRGKGNYVALAGSGTNPALQFRNGDTITIAAWIRCDKIGADQNQYIIGKGRTHRDGFSRDNQNWALRLRGHQGQGKLSFLFRSRDEKGSPGEYHRWTSRQGVSPGSRWHHLAVTYEFGKPESIRALVNGKPSKGTWDMGMATARPPVTDDDEVWIGSALGGSPSNTLNGAIASISVFREAVPALAEVFQIRGGIPAPRLKSLPAGRVLVEIFPNDAGAKDWPILLEEPIRSVDAEGFALFRMPPTYGPGGRRHDQDGPHYLRFAAHLTLPAGKHEFLLRAPSLAKLSIGEDELALLGPQNGGGDAHGPLRPRASFPYPRARLGTYETKATWSSDGSPRLISFEALLGDPGGKVQAGDLLVAVRAENTSTWQILSPKTPIPFTGAGLERFRQEERRHQEQLDTTLRRRLADDVAGTWKARHDHALAHLASLPPLEIPDLPSGFAANNTIDHFIAARIHEARRESPDPDSSFQKTIHPLLEKQCFRCHGKKSKGGLRLDSREALLKGGESGPAIVPGQPRKSELHRRVLTDDEEDRMPPKGDRLSDTETAALADWIKAGAKWERPAVTVTVPEPLGDLAFLRRLYLDTVGVFPTPVEIERYLSDRAADKTARLIDLLLADPRHADHWVSYWQDVLAENPRLVKPTLNNTGPFRWWLHEALLDNMPFDRFVTELVTFSGGTYSGAPGGFKLATQNDVPMAAKAHIIGTAFLGVEMKCARCHDAPYHPFKQEQLFSLAAMLGGSSLKVPASSTVPTEFFKELGDRKPLIQVTLQPNTAVQPNWPFDSLASERTEDPTFANSADRLAYQITRPENTRFARVIVNRLWKRYFGQGFVEPANDWEGNAPSHPALLDFLAREFVSHGYDLHHLSRLILNSAVYRRAPRLEAIASPESRFFEAPLRRRLTAEQLVDSLFAATGTPVFSEELTFDLEGWQPPKNFLNFGRPRRAWEFVSLSTERDRPSLTLPHADAIVSLLEAYGWRPNRTEPLTERKVDPNVLQSGMLANGLLGTWWSRLSNHSDLTRVALEAKSPAALIEHLYLRFLTREPSETERLALLELLAPGFDTRIARPAAEFEKDLFVPAVREVSWRNHLNPEATRVALHNADQAEEGPQPTDFLTPGWRERLEDTIWALINSPELQFTP